MERVIAQGFVEVGSAGGGYLGKAGQGWRYWQAWMRKPSGVAALAADASCRRLSRPSSTSKRTGWAAKRARLSLVIAHGALSAPSPKPDDWSDVSPEEMAELERAAADEDGDGVVPAEQFFADLGIAWPPPARG